MHVHKLDGSSEAFDPAKLEASLQRSGVGKKMRKDIIAQIRPELYDGISTSAIYRRAFQLLESYHQGPEASFRYSLRRAISEFGPSGFPFEKFVGEVFRLQGYHLQVGKKVKGRCITHEVDLIGDRGGERLTAELKFHNKLSIKTDLKVALYVRARFDDLQAGGVYGRQTPRLAVITNTKFSTNAIRYGACAGLELIGWNHPRGRGNLHDLIIQSGIHPLTCLATLSKKQKRYFLDQGMVLCQELTTNQAQPLREATSVLPQSKIAKVLEEIETICRCIGPSCRVVD